MRFAAKPSTTDDTSRRDRGTKIDHNQAHRCFYSNLMSKPVSASLGFICCFLLVLAPQAAGLNVSPQKPVSKSAPIKKARKSQTPASPKSSGEDKTKPSDRRVVYQGI